MDHCSILHDQELKSGVTCIKQGFLVGHKLGEFKTFTMQILGNDNLQNKCPSPPKTLFNVMKYLKCHEIFL